MVTYLVWNNISNGNTIDTAYVDLANNKITSKLELSKRKMLKAQLSKYYPEAKIRNDIIFNMPEILTSDLMCPQAAIWLFVSHLIFDSSKHSHVEIGYVKEDDFWHFNEKMSNAHNQLCNTIRHEDFSVKYPLEWLDKKEIYQTYCSLPKKLKNKRK